METVVEYRRIIQDHTPQAIRRIGVGVANFANVSEITATTLPEAEQTEEQIIDTGTSRASLRASAARLSGSVVLLGANTVSVALEHGVINTVNTILEPALIATSGVLASVVHDKRANLKKAYETVYDLLYVSKNAREERSKFKPIKSEKLGSMGEVLGIDGIDFAGAFESSFKRAANNGKHISARATLKSEGLNEKFNAEDVHAVRPSTKFGYFNIIFKKVTGETVDYRAIKDISYSQMEKTTASLSYSKNSAEAVDKKANPLYTLPLLRTSVFINLIRKGRRVLSKDSTR